MKVNKIVSETLDSRTYKLALRSVVLGCPICGPNRGCNSRGKGRQRNWKKFRKTKFKKCARSSVD
jgi:hypothetical protein